MLQLTLKMNDRLCMKLDDLQKFSTMNIEHHHKVTTREETALLTYSYTEREVISQEPLQAM